MQRREKVIMQIKRVIEDGLLIIVIGWKPSNHDTFTRSLPTNRVRFFFRSPPKLPRRAGIILYTRFVSHGEIERASKSVTTNSNILQLGELRQILRSVFGGTAVIKQALEREEVPMKSAPKRLEPVPEREDKAELETSPPKIDPLLTFAKFFLEAVDNDPDKTLGKFRTANLIRRALGEELSANIAQQLVRDGWLEPVKLEGKKYVSYYRAGAKMLEAHTAPEPTEPIQRAKWIVENEGKLLTRKEELLHELDKLEKEIQKVSEAKDLLARLTKLMEE